MTRLLDTPAWIQRALGEPSFATPAIAHETLCFRTESHLIVVGGL